MIIEQSSILMASRYEASQSYSTRESLRLWFGGKPVAERAINFEQSDGTVIPTGATDESLTATSPVTTTRAPEIATSDIVTISPEALTINDGDETAETAPLPEEDPLQTTLNPKLEVLKALLEKLHGRKIGWFNQGQLEKHLDRLENKAQTMASKESSRAGFGMQYEFVERYTESESVQFATEGIIKTADGKEIDISVSLSMSRTYVEENRLSIQAGDKNMMDPLVVNFGGNAAQLTQTRFEFDLNSDGQLEEIPFVSTGSGLLALDVNGDGVINDGSELFGPSTGNGMAELADLDDDGNRWIDEKDQAYSQLSVWSKDTEGNDNLQGLKEAGVGAIYLDSVETPFALKDDQNVTQGQVRSTGIYLAESAAPGTIQQIDLAV